VVRLALIGEAWGEEEDRAKRPFVGKSGLLLNSILGAVGIDRSSCLITNAFNLRPPGNKIQKILVKKAESAPGWPRLAGKYLPPSLVPEIERMRQEIRDFKPQAIVTLGAVALWGLTGAASLGTHRGHYHEWEGIPMIPTYHPARILRSYHLKISLAGDLEKAKKLATGELKPDTLKYNAEPTLDHIAAFYERAKSLGICSADIETSPKVRAITCIGFGTPDEGICIPFAHNDKPQYSYWPTISDEVKALRLVKAILEDQSIAKIFHHAAYDIPWIADVWGIQVRGPIEDTRIMHATLLAELPHSLSDVTAGYCCFPPWKSEWNSSKDSDATSESISE